MTFHISLGRKLKTRAYSFCSLDSLDLANLGLSGCPVFDRLDYKGWTGNLSPFYAQPYAKFYAKFSRLLLLFLVRRESWVLPVRCLFLSSSPSNALPTCLVVSSTLTRTGHVAGPVAKKTRFLSFPTVSTHSSGRAITISRGVITGPVVRFRISGYQTTKAWYELAVCRCFRE